MCNGFGVDGPVVIGLVAACIVLSPVLVPVAAAAYAAGAAKESVEKAERRRRTTNLLKKIKNRYIKRLKAGEWQGYLQEVFDRTQSEPSASNLHELGVAMLLADDAIKAEQYLSSAMAAVEGTLSQYSCSDWPKDVLDLKARILFARGLTNQTLRDYNAATEDFQNAAEVLAQRTPGNDVAAASDAAGGGAEGAEAAPAAQRQLPQLTEAECRNSLGYSLYLRALYAVMQSRDYVRLGTEMALDGFAELPLPQTAVAEVAAFARSATGDVRAAQARGLLQKALASYDAAIALTEHEPRGMFIFNRGKVKYYLALLPSMSAAQASGESSESIGPLHLGDAEEHLMLEALRDFEACVGMENFGTTAEGHAMRGQALAVLGRLEEAKEAMERAVECDQKAFIVDLDSPEQLVTPWPLPPAPRGDQLHDFEDRSFYAPHFCDHCMTLVPSFRPASCCRRCEFFVHRGCLAKASTLRSCWGPTEPTPKVGEEDKPERSLSLTRMLGLKRGGEDDAPEAHVHKMTFVHFHKPTWCDACGGFAVVPWGYRCVECRFRAHVDCLDTLSSCVVVDRDTS